MAADPRSRHGRLGAAGRAGLGGLAVALAVAALAPASARADYDPRRAAHPLRVVGYVLHPVGFVLDRAFVRPLYRLGQREPFRSVFGVERDPADEPSGIARAEGEEGPGAPR